MRKFLFAVVLGMLFFRSLPLFADVLLPSERLRQKNGVIERLLENKTNKQEKRYKSNQTKKCQKDLLCDWLGKPITGVVIGEHEQHSALGEIPYVDGRKEGIAKWYNERELYGDVIGETSYKNNKKEGPEKWFYENGNLSIETTYKDDKENGVKKIYDWNGNLLKEEMYKDGILNGIEKEYGQDGTVVSETHYKDGKRVFIRNYEGEKIKTEMVYKDDKKEIDTKEYDQNGNLTEIIDNGKRREIVVMEYDQDGKLADETIYMLYNSINVTGFRFSDSDGTIIDDGLMYIKEKDFQQEQQKRLQEAISRKKMKCRNTQNGIEKSQLHDGGSIETSCKDGKKDGIEKKYLPPPFDNSVTESLFRDGEKISEKGYNIREKEYILSYEVPYKMRTTVETSYNAQGFPSVSISISDEMDGIDKWYCSDGRIWREIPYNMGKENGSEKYYDKNGNVIWKNEYINGKSQGLQRRFASICTGNEEYYLEIQYDDGKAVSGYTYFLLNGERKSQKLTDKELENYSFH